MYDAPTLHADLTAMIRANGEADVGSMTRRILDGLDEQGRKLLRKIEDDMGCEAAGWDTRLSLLAIYGGEEAARDLIRDAKWHRENAVKPIPAIEPVKVHPTRRRAA